METRRLVANWKLNLPAEGAAPFLDSLEPIEGVEVGVAPPFPFIAELAARASSTRIGAQNCSEQDTGAFTGEVSAEMLSIAGASFVIVGHSERRALYGEDAVLVGKKARRVSDAGLQPLVCIGEQESARAAGETERVLEEQLKGLVEGWSGLPSDLLIAYEPVWAIGTGRNATPGIAGETHAAIRTILRGIGGVKRVSILYGGSVKPDNAAELAAVDGIDGFLVGGASLVSSSFMEIGRALSSAQGKA